MPWRFILHYFFGIFGRSPYYLGSSEEIFSEGLQTLSKDGLCGFINEQGQEATPFEWDYCENFHNGLAYVEKDGRMAYIDHAGAVVWKEE